MPLRRPFRALVVLAVSLLASPACAGEPAFLGGFEDLPLMDALSEVEGAGIVFDTPGGRIVERYARGPTDARSVAGFYRATLPALGWRAAGPLTFEREGEQLTITVYPPDSESRVTVRFSLAPS
jgi:hypothetical protein